MTIGGGGMVSEKVKVYGKRKLAENYFPASILIQY